MIIHQHAIRVLHVIPRVEGATHNMWMIKTSTDFARVSSMMRLKDNIRDAIPYHKLR